MTSAQQKAERLLRRTLPRKEWLRYILRGYVLCRGSKGGLYKLTKKKAYGIFEWTGKKHKLCAVPDDVHQLEFADIIVAQYLSLINNEKKFIKTCNVGTVGASPLDGVFLDVENINRMMAERNMQMMQNPGDVHYHENMTATEVLRRQEEFRYGYHRGIPDRHRGIGGVIDRLGREMMGHSRGDRRFVDYVIDHAIELQRREGEILEWRIVCDDINDRIRIRFRFSNDRYHELVTPNPNWDIRHEMRDNDSFCGP